MQNLPRSGFETAAWPALGMLAAGAAICVAVLAVLLKSRIADRIVDHPNHRSMHVDPTPRIGGLGLLAGIVLPLALSRASLPVGLWAALAMLVAVSLLDDLRGLSAAVRLPMHLLAAALACVSVAPDLPATWIAMAAVAVGWAINLFNFMDGLDGLAGGQAVFGFGAYAIAALHAGDPAIASVSAVTVGAAIGFLFFNLPPARLFMGDAGSTSLGLVAGVLGVLGAARGVWPMWFPVVAFLPFVLDATLTVALRILRGSRFWEAHREHAYQRLTLMGLGRRTTLLVYYALMAAAATAALAGLDAPAVPSEAAAFGLLLVALYAGVLLAGSRRSADRLP